MAKGKELQQIKQALARGRLTIMDPATGYHQNLYAHCPVDHVDASVYRVDRSGVPITRVIFRCSICGKEFEAGPRAMFIRQA
jgi:hypothetical protein